MLKTRAPPARPPPAVRCPGNVLIEKSSHWPRKLPCSAISCWAWGPEFPLWAPTRHPAPRFRQAVHVGGLPFLLSPLLGRTAGHRDGGGSGQSRPGPGHRRLPGKMACSFHTSSLCKLAQEAACGLQGRWPPGLQLILRFDWRCMGFLS